ncbi:MAG: chemotaxis protein CheW [Planctomycetes bacterium]|nr:chemotaxis protein CheW [Planctomycetota bacterium]
MASSQQLCTFHLERLFFGVSVQEVQEVIRYQEMTPVPLAPSVVSGLINLRGQIVTAIDLRRRFGMPDRETGRLPMNVVVRTDEGPVSLLVDEIGDVLEADGDHFEAVPPTLSKEMHELLRGVYKVKGALLLVLDTGRALQSGPPAARAPNR